MQEYVRDQNIRKLSPATIKKRVEILERLRGYLGRREPPVDLLAVAADDLRSFQATFAHRQPRTIDIYTRHLQDFFRWAHERGLTEVDPASELSRPRLPKCLPHPTTLDDLALIFATADDDLRLPFALAAFTGLRRGEVCALQRQDLFLDSPLIATALVHGKGSKERRVPLLAPVVEELRRYGLPRSGYVLTRNGRPWIPDRMSTACYRFLRGIGVESTLHAARHAFATHAARITHDPVLVKQLLGHESLDTTMIYVEADLSGAHLKLAQMATLAGGLLASAQPVLPLAEPELRVAR